MYTSRICIENKLLTYRKRTYRQTQIPHIISARLKQKKVFV